MAFLRISRTEIVFFLQKAQDKKESGCLKITKDSRFCVLFLTYKYVYRST